MHEARKDLKKLRALLRMTRGELGDATFRRENPCFRDAGRELAGVRDERRDAGHAEGARPPRRGGVGAAQDDPGLPRAERRRRCAARPPPAWSRCCARRAGAWTTGHSSATRSMRCARRPRAHIPPRTPRLPGGAGDPDRRGAPRVAQAREGALVPAHAAARAVAAGDAGRRQRGARARQPARRRPRPGDAGRTGCASTPRRSPSSSRPWRRRRSELQVEAMALGERLYADKPRRLRAPPATAVEGLADIC